MSELPSKFHVAVCGGGIGGLTLAFASVVVVSEDFVVPSLQHRKADQPDGLAMGALYSRGSFDAGCAALKRAHNEDDSASGTRNLLPGPPTARHRSCKTFALKREYFSLRPLAGPDHHAHSSTAQLQGIAKQIQDNFEWAFETEASVDLERAISMLRAELAT